MNAPQPETSQIGRYQITSWGQGSVAGVIAVLDTATGRVWVREISGGIGGDKALLKAENQGSPLWAIPHR
jgi:hypothetical protein